MHINLQNGVLVWKIITNGQQLMKLLIRFDIWYKHLYAVQQFDTV